MSTISTPSSADPRPYLDPAFEVGVETGVVYAVRDGYWSQGTSSGPKLSQVALWRRPLDLKMDIYFPVDNRAEGRPLLLMMHGGSFLFGNRGEAGQAAWCRHFASLGYVAVSIDYRLGFWPSKHGLLQAEADALDDADSALAYLLRREDLRIDPGRVFVAGTSAGGFLAMGLAYSLYGAHPPRDPSPAWGRNSGSGRSETSGATSGIFPSWSMRASPSSPSSRSRTPSFLSTAGIRCVLRRSLPKCTAPAPPARGPRSWASPAPSIPARRSATGCTWTRRAGSRPAITKSGMRWPLSSRKRWKSGRKTVFLTPL